MGTVTRQPSSQKWRRLCMGVQRRIQARTELLVMLRVEARGWREIFLDLPKMTRQSLTMKKMTTNVMTSLM